VKLENLRQNGYFAEGPWTCCASCGWEEISESDKVVFWHNQTHEKAFNDSLELVGNLYLQWAGDANEIITTFVKNGFQAQWSGNPDKCIIILPG